MLLRAFTVEDGAKSPVAHFSEPSGCGDIEKRFIIFQQYLESLKRPVKRRGIF